MADQTQAKKILVVDDDSDMRLLIGSILEDRGYGVLYAQDGLEGLQKNAEKNCDLIILDVEMPNMHGLGVLDTLKKQGARVPVIMASSRHDAQTWAASMNLGAKKFLHKPFTAKALLAAVEKAIGSP